MPGPAPPPPMAAEPQDVVSAELDRLAGHVPALGIAVSGGGDSVALLQLAQGWARGRGVRIEAATVDHRLRAESANEAARVAAMAEGLGVPHAVLTWGHQGIAGNVMDAARRARMHLLAGWARDRGIPAVALGHTQDDQAETLLMRLARGAGLDGLSGMAAARDQHGIRWLRPMLGLRRPALRGWLADREIAWIDDPTNEDVSYDRVRTRRAIQALDLPVEALARSAAHLAEARAALAEAAVAAAGGATADRGLLRLPRGSLCAAPEIRRRLVVAALRWVTGADYPPRGEDVGRLIETLAAGGQGTLDGVIARVRDDAIEFLREPAAAARADGAPSRDIPPESNPGEAVWDRRWRLAGVPPGATITVAEAHLPGRDWRAAGLPRLAVASSPAVCTQGRVIVPLIDPSPVGAMPLRGRDDYLAILRAH